MMLGLIIWIIGWLFTCGLSDAEGIYVVLTFVFWPAYLGVYFRK